MTSELNIKSHRVALVLDKCFGMRLLELAKRVHVWIVSSTINEKACEVLWSFDGGSYSGYSLDSGATPFKTFINENMPETLLDLIPMIFDHHSPWDHDPPMTELEVYGLTLNDEVQSVLDELELVLIGSEGDGLVFYSNPWD